MGAVGASSPELIEAALLLRHDEDRRLQQSVSADVVLGEAR
jgi:hypothetical protein